MNILVSAPEYPRPGAPYTAFIREVVEEMARQGHQITVVAPQSITTNLKRKLPFLPQEYTYNIEHNGNIYKIQVLRPYVITVGEGRFVAQSAKLCRWIVCKALNKLNFKIDVVYSHFWSSAYNVLPFAQKINASFFVASGEDVINMTKWSGKDFVSQVCEYTKGVICVSTKNKNESVNLGLTVPIKCIILPNAVNPQYFYKQDKWKLRKKYSFPQDAFIIAFCGRFNNRKGVMRLNDSLNMINNLNIKAILIGSLVENERNIPNYSGIIHMGQVEHDVIAEYLNCADIFVSPTLAEGCSNSIVEAMACGLPIISSDLPFNHDILDEKNSILLDPVEVNEIALAIQKLYNNRELVRQMGEESLNRAKGLNIYDRVSKILAFITLCK